MERAGGRRHHLVPAGRARACRQGARRQLIRATWVSRGERDQREGTLRTSQTSSCCGRPVAAGRSCRVHRCCSDACGVAVAQNERAHGAHARSACTERTKHAHHGGARRECAGGRLCASMSSKKNACAQAPWPGCGIGASGNKRPTTPGSATKPQKGGAAQTRSLPDAPERTHAPPTPLPCAPVPRLGRARASPLFASGRPAGCQMSGLCAGFTHR